MYDLYVVELGNMRGDAIPPKIILTGKHPLKYIFKFEHPRKEKFLSLSIISYNLHS